MIDLFGTKKKKKLEREKEIQDTGIIMGVMPDMDRDRMRIANIFLNGIINFIVLFSTIMIVTDSFDIKMNLFMFTVVLFLFCIFIASFYEFRVVKILGYIAIVIAFIYGITEYHGIIRGGFGTFANAFMEVIEVKLDLPIERRYQEFTANRILAVTVCAIFVACSLAMILNIAITEAKGFALTFLITFPIVQLGIYFDRDISLVYFGLYIAAMIALMILRSSVHYKSETKKNKGYHVIEKKDVRRYEYVNDGRNSLSIMIFLVIVILCTAIAANFTAGRNFRMPDKYGEWKKGTESFAKKTALVGFYGMFNKNGSGTGGISRSKLGDTKYVKMDYQTDLSVETQVRENEPIIYLRAYTGTYYADNSWKYISESAPKEFVQLAAYGVSKEQACSVTVDILEQRDYLYKIHEPIKRITVFNVDANEDFLYFHNNAKGIYKQSHKVRNDDEIEGTLPVGVGLKYYYYPLKNMPLDELEKTALSLREEVSEEMPEPCYEVEECYREFVQSVYLDVPDDNIKSIDSFIESYGLKKEDGLKNVQKIADIFENDYTYTLMPGVTPEDKDFVNYFLDKTHKGYCTYFASSAVLILRRLGIPARYAGGYAVPTTEEDNMYKKNNLSIPDMYQIDVNDSNAHAWVEVYVNNLGWVNADVTPSDDETEDEEENDTGFVGMLASNIFSPDTARAIRNTTVSVFKVAVMVLVVIVLCFVIAGIVIRYTRRRNTDINDNIKYVRNILGLAGISWKENMTYMELAGLLESKCVLDTNDIGTFIEVIEREKYSKKGATDEEKQFIHSLVLQMGRKIYDSIPVSKKFIFIYIKCLIKE